MPLDQLDEYFWEDLLSSISEGKVIPVIGGRVVTTSPHETSLYSELAKHLANALQISDDKLSESPTLNEVVVTHNLNQPGKSNLPYVRLFNILKKQNYQPGKLLKDLAKIRDFNLFLTTTVDSLLEKALNEVRYKGLNHTAVASFNKGEDLPCRKKDLDSPLVYHLFGKASTAPEYVLWEGDTLESVIALHDALRSSESLSLLSRDLSEHGLLLIGMSFSDWLVRFFLRVALQDKFSSRAITPTYFADNNRELGDSDLVMFFGAFSNGVNVVKCCPMEFVSELSRRWAIENPMKELPVKSFEMPIPQTMPKGAVFISYASEDKKLVYEIVGQLQDAGIDVWFDRERLKAGSYWKNQLEQEVKGGCSLFLSIISSTTENRPEGYFHLERSWAAERFQGFSQGKETTEFYVGIIIDDSPLPPKREPQIFHQTQIIKQKDGILTKEFIDRVKLLQDNRKRIDLLSS